MGGPEGNRKRMDKDQKIKAKALQSHGITGLDSLADIMSQAVKDNLVAGDRRAKAKSSICRYRIQAPLHNRRPFMASVVMALVDHELKLEDPVEKYLPIKGKADDDSSAHFAHGRLLNENITDLIRNFECPLDALIWSRYDLALRLVESRDFFSGAVEANLLKLMQSKDFFIARRAREFLSGQKLSASH